MKIHRLTGIRVFEGAWIQIREDINQQVFQLIAATVQSSAEVFNLAAALIE